MSFARIFQSAQKIMSFFVNYFLIKFCFSYLEIIQTSVFSSQKVEIHSCTLVQYLSKEVSIFLIKSTLQNWIIPHVHCTMPLYKRMQQSLLLATHLDEIEKAFIIERKARSSYLMHRTRGLMDEKEENSTCH